MKFETRLTPDLRAVKLALGYGNATPDERTEAAIEAVSAQVMRAAVPRWVYRVFGFEWPPRLPEGALLLPGKDIQAHLDGCSGCVMLAVTLGDGVDRLLRTLQAADMQQALLADTIASIYVEQYADVAQANLLEKATKDNQYITSRYSPGYGDLPLELQRDFLCLLDAQKTIGLLLTPGGMLVPGKSITAIIGTANKPVSGKMAGCENCALRGRCNRKGDLACGNFV